MLESVAVECGVFPSARSEDEEEERLACLVFLFPTVLSEIDLASCRRLLYVACTRAQGLLYLTHATSRMVAGEQKPAELSPFIATVRSDAKVCASVCVL